MLYQFGYVYHIKDSFFEKVNDSRLMKNKENGNQRPTYYAAVDGKTGLVWVVPMSSQIDKYKKIYDKQIEKYGKCNTVVLGKYCGNETAFLIQNMFPITNKYIDHIHTKNGNPVPVHTKIQKELNRNIEKVFQLMARGKNIVFPNVKRIEQLMLEELKMQNEMDIDNEMELE